MLEGVTPLLQKLERPNFLLLRRLMLFLKEVSTHSAKNKMGVRNLATIFGPNILRQEDQSDMMAMVRDSGYITSLAMALIENAETLFAPVRPSVALHFVHWLTRGSLHLPPRKGARGRPSQRRRRQASTLASSLPPTASPCGLECFTTSPLSVTTKSLSNEGIWCRYLRFLETVGAMGWSTNTKASSRSTTAPTREWLSLVKIPLQVRLLPVLLCPFLHADRCAAKWLLSPRAPVVALRSPLPSPLQSHKGGGNVRSLHNMLKKKQKHQSQVFQTMEDAQRKVVLQQLEIDRLRSDLEKLKLQLVQEQQERKMFEMQALVHVDNFTQSMLTIAESAMATRAVAPSSGASVPSASS